MTTGFDQFETLWVTVADGVASEIDNPPVNVMTRSL